jgi:hypothetical protein
MLWTLGDADGRGLPARPVSRHGLRRLGETVVTAVCQSRLTCANEALENHDCHTNG